MPVGGSGERKLATMVFADLVSSTHRAGSEDPERTRVLLERFYDAMAVEVEAAGGTIEKFAGDAVMAVFGTPAALEDHAERALHAALAMRRRVEDVEAGGLAVRIGVNTGEVVAGAAREGSSFVSGDAVNVAARLEQAAEPGQILAGERTVAVARGAFDFAEPATVEAKGKPGGVVAYEVLRPLSLMRPRGVGGLASALVGRKQELLELVEEYRRTVASGKPRLVAIVGDAGVGKTRLVRELWQRLEQETPVPLRRTGRCLAYGHGITYWPLGELLKEHLGILESDPPDRVLAKLGERRLLGLTLGLDLAADLHPLAARDLFREQWVAFLGEIVAERPTVVLVEDLHWADDLLVELLGRLVRDVGGSLLVLVTARPDFLDRAAALVGRVDATVVRLERLGEAPTIELTERLLATSLPAGLGELVVSRAEGNPFFVEELLGSLIDQGVLVRGDADWLMTADAALPPVPDSVQAVIASRIDLLEPDEKAALQAASVMGRVFWTRPLYEMLGEAAPDLTVLEDRDLIRRRAPSSLPGEVEYVFKHALTREVAYESLTRARRAQLHAAFARWLEASASDAQAASLAHHYFESARPENADLAWAGAPATLHELRTEAARWLLRAAGLARSRYEIEDAVTLLQRALLVEDDAERQAETWRRIGEAHLLAFDGEAFWTAMQRAIELSQDGTRIAEAYSLLALRTSTTQGMWKKRPEAQLAEEWVEQALALAPAGTAAHIRALIARALLHPERDENALGAIAEAEEFDDPELLSWALAARTTAAMMTTRLEDAYASLERRLPLLDEIQDPDHVSLAYMDAGWVLIALGRVEDVRRIAAANTALTAPLTAHHRLHAVAQTLEADYAAGEWQAIAAQERNARDAVEANETPCGMNPLTLLMCAAARAHLGSATEAGQLAQTALDLGMQGWDSLLRGYRLRVALACSDRDAVEELLSPLVPEETTFESVHGVAARLDALALLSACDLLEEEAPRLLGRHSYAEPFALRALGLTRGDTTLVAQAIDGFQAMGCPWYAQQTRSLAASG